MERHPVRMFDVLREAHALGRLLPEVDAVDDAGWRATVDALERTVAGDAPIEVRFAVALQSVAAAAIDPLCARLAVPRAVRDVAVLAAAEGPGLQATLSDPGAAGSAPSSPALPRPSPTTPVVRASGSGSPGCSTPSTRSMPARSRERRRSRRRSRSGYARPAQQRSTNCGKMSPRPQARTDADSGVGIAFTRVSSDAARIAAYC
jgi:hypothetical protein